jgi:hypothetical protein
MPQLEYAQFLYITHVRNGCKRAIVLNILTVKQFIGVVHKQYMNPYLFNFVTHSNTFQLPYLYQK